MIGFRSFWPKQSYPREVSFRWQRANTNVGRLFLISVGSKNQLPEDTKGRGGQAQAVGEGETQESVKSQQEEVWRRITHVRNEESSLFQTAK